MSLGDRLRTVRKELGLSQGELAEIAGVIPNTQSIYERGKRMPDAGYLEKLFAIGGDVTYILTGLRMQAPTLSPVEEDLLDNFRACEEADQSAIRRLVMRSAEARRLRTRARPGNPQEAQAAL
jgi:transcriptional regulator with XRE-family HTH domain